jgi:hypothetical protein
VQCAFSEQVNLKSETFTFSPSLLVFTAWGGGGGGGRQFRGNNRPTMYRGSI